MAAREPDEMTGMHAARPKRLWPESRCRAANASAGVFGARLVDCAVCGVQGSAFVRRIAVSGWQHRRERAV